MRRRLGLTISLALTLATAAADRAFAQDSRAAIIEAEQAAKARTLAPYVTTGAEKVIVTLQRKFLEDPSGFYPYFASVYSGGGFTLGAGYRQLLRRSDARGSRRACTRSRTTSSSRSAPIRWATRRDGWTCTRAPAGATRPRSRFTASGMDTPEDAAVFGMKQAYVGGDVGVHPVPWTTFHAGLSFEDFTLGEGSGSKPSIEEVHTPATAPGLGASPSYLHFMTSAGIDTRPSPGYARRGGLYQVTYHNYADRDDTYSFDRVDAEVVQHIPILRENWVLSLHGLLQTTLDDADTVPYFLLPSLGSGSTLRGYSSWRFRDRNSLLMSGEWRWIPNRLALDMALFYDTGKVTPRVQRHQLEGSRERRRHRRALSRPARRRRCGSSWRRAARASSSCSPAARRSDRMHDTRLACFAALAGRRRRHAPRATRRRRGTAGSSMTTIRWRASRRRRTRRASARGTSTCSSISPRTCSRDPGDPAAGVRARRHQHHRRSAGLELVHQSHPRAAARDRRGGARSARPAPGRRRAPGRSCGPRRPASRRASRCATRRGDLWFVSFDARGFPEAATGAILVANKIFWALGYWQVENYLVDVRPDQLVIADSAKVTPAVRQGARRCGSRDLEDVLRRAHRSADGGYRAIAAPRRARPSARRVPLLRHAARRSERHRAARAPPRAARAEGVRRLDQPHRHEGRQHARRAGDRRTAAAWSATTCRTSARRSAPAPTRRTTTTRAGSRSSTASSR